MLTIKSIIGTPCSLFLNTHVVIHCIKMVQGEKNILDMMSSSKLRIPLHLGESPKSPI